MIHQWGPRVLHLSIAAVVLAAPGGCSLKTGGEVPADAMPDGPACPEGQILCGAFCVDPVTDRFNCGGCGKECEALEACVDARCDCLEGYARCDGACVNVQIDRRHCGACNRVCDPLATCQGGICVCPSGLTDCGGECVDTNTDSQNCGGCGIICTGGEFCNGRGSCSVECDPPFTLCSPGGDAYCADLDRDPYNCGGCAAACGPFDHAVPECEDGTCGLTCDFGYGDANGILDDGCECTVTSTEETCDGRDDNCDGRTDEGFECPRGALLDCTIIASCSGMRMCTAECTWTECTSLVWECTAPGSSDSRHCGTGDCGSQSRTCLDDCTWGDWSACVLRPGTECFPGESYDCVTSCGSTGTRACTGACVWSACQPPGETCNGADDDCDGTCDNGFACCSGASGTCTTSCGTTGSRTCSGACAWSGCAPPAETCNGSDDDCDGSCDETFDCCRGSTSGCSTSCGTSGSRTCSNTCMWGSCIPPAETCNGADDDCDGQCDEGFNCCSGATGTCTTSCGTTGTRTCRSSCTWGTCQPPAETCNGLDDDCDGLCDEGFECCAGVGMRCTVDPATGADAIQRCSSACRWGTLETCSSHPQDQCCMVGPTARCCVQCSPPNNCI